MNNFCKLGMDNTINAPGPKEITRRSKDYKVKRPAAAITKRKYW
jgi:hypothetical protein